MTTTTPKQTSTSWNKIILEELFTSQMNPEWCIIYMHFRNTFHTEIILMQNRVPPALYLMTARRCDFQTLLSCRHHCTVHFSNIHPYYFLSVFHGQYIPCVVIKCKSIIVKSDNFQPCCDILDQAIVISTYKYGSVVLGKGTIIVS